MTTSMEALLAELTREVRANTGSYIEMKTTLEGMRTDYSELRDLVGSLAQVQATHSERLTASETRMSDLQHVHQELSTLKAQLRGMEVRIESHAPVKSPWTATMAALVALAALLWTLFGR